ncbi:putative membrane protein [Streptomyces ambofaciens ATCC 23877]|uniref:Putative membrane protein n=1 Tax=Streptomyces ambofaciens (strain ATCC 23877 / 3486 / DSM 40053 / JCM 4204 / NBRC 12836 / NRRL B-2516) TaxID=278992 RepID=A0A0K2ASD5_STRA7|nr:hypothetical protein [Streptomyces ambofaciens]AKZ55737.1 putative membrane protein [Streptomyces ambofaciens ATCC 23877]
MAAGHPGGDDALMAAITGEPLPPGADADAEAAYRSAAADVALLREQLGVIGRSLGEPPRAPETAPVAPPARRSPRRPFALALGALAVACAGTVLTGLGWLVAQGSGGGADAAGDSAVADDKRAGSAEAGVAFGSPRYLACARVVAEGTVTGAEPLPAAGSHGITLDVTRSYKPEGPADGPMTFVLEDTTARLAAGDHALIGIPRYGDTPDAVIIGEEAVAVERARITASLPESRTLTCD